MASPCPTDEVLADLGLGVLAEPELGRVLAHLDGCADCRERAAAAAEAAQDEQPASERPTRPSEPVRAGHAAGLEPGTQLGRYRVTGVLGSGGMGLVLRAHDPQLQRDVALKVMHPQGASGLPSMEHLLEEARAAGKLVHPNLVTVFDVGVDRGHAFVAMQLVEGPTLTRWLANRRPPLRQILSVFVAAGEGLAAAHRAGLVHRDFKPENVLLGPDDVPLVADFGLARAALAPSAPEDLPGSVTFPAGTPGYMAPEQYAARSDLRSDEFAFCVSLWVALTGVKPFPAEKGLEGMRGAPQGRLPRGLSRRAKRAILRGMSFRPEQRFLSMEALLAELRPRPVPAGLVLAAGVALAVGVVLAGVGLRTFRPAEGELQSVGEVGDGPVDVAGRPDAGETADGGGTADAGTGDAGPGDTGNGDAVARAAKAAPVRKELKRSLAKGSIVLRVNPWAEVLLDGKKVGTTPLPPLAVSAGRHELVLENREIGARQVLTVLVTEGRESVVRANLLK